MTQPGKTFWIIVSSDLAGLNLHYGRTSSAWVEHGDAACAKRFRSKASAERLIIQKQLSDDTPEWRDAQVVEMAELDEEVW